MKIGDLVIHSGCHCNYHGAIGIYTRDSSRGSPTLLCFKILYLPPEAIHTNRIGSEVELYVGGTVSTNDPDHVVKAALGVLCQ